MQELLEAKRDLVVSQLVEAREGFESKIAHLNSEALAQEKDLELAHEELTILQKRYQELLQ